MILGGMQSDGWLEGCHHFISPFCDERPCDKAINLLVIHNISLPAGCFANPYIKKLFTEGVQGDEHPSFQDLAGLKVSSHFLIDRAGGVSQFVPVHKRAWHAGRSSFCGESGCNDFSIGIELEGTDTWVYTASQYQSLLMLTELIVRVFPEITLDRIVGHDAIAPDRKTDPGPSFDWHLYREKCLKFIK